MWERPSTSDRKPGKSSSLYQFDWNPYVEVIGAQGTYFVIGYSESSDLGGCSACNWCSCRQQSWNCS